MQPIQSDKPDRPRTRLELVVSWLPPKVDRALDAGCSTGEITAALAERSNSAQGFDPDAASIATARQRYPSLEFNVHSLEQTPLPSEAFDVIVCADVLEHVDDDVAAARELVRLLRPGGTLILSTPHRGFFAFLDPANLIGSLQDFVARRIPALHRLQRRVRGREVDDVPVRDIHRHYSSKHLVELLRTAAPHSELVVSSCFRSGLLLYPLGILGIVLTSAFVPRPLRQPLVGFAERLIEWDYGRDYGRAAYNVALRLVKQPVHPGLSDPPAREVSSAST